MFNFSFKNKIPLFNNKIACLSGACPDVNRDGRITMNRDPVRGFN